MSRIIYDLLFDNFISTNDKNLTNTDIYMKYVNGAEKTINILNERYKKYSEKLEEEEKLNDNKEIFKNIKEYENIKTLNKKLIDDLINNIYSNEDGTIEIEFKYQDEYKKLLKLAKKIKKNT